MNDDLKQVSRITILSTILADQIAAGEVVERPASVVKELVENAIDANAKSITVNIEHGGLSLIEIIDDGNGMSPDDAEKCIERFATSKIESADDLLSLQSFGFRGEALPSIASISRTTILTHREGFPGCEVKVEGGVKRGVTLRDTSIGTRITVRDLFYNTPARREFVRTEKTELQQIKTVLEDLSLSQPNIRFSLTHDGREVKVLPPTSSMMERARFLELAGKSPFECQAEIIAQSGTYGVTALLSVPEEAVQSASKLRLLVNGRVVRDKLLLRAIRDAYGQYLRGNQYPQGFLSLKLPPRDVDVNVHPQKAEVRFRRSEAIFQVTRLAFKNGAEGHKNQSFAQPASFFQNNQRFESGSSFQISSSLPLKWFGESTETMQIVPGDSLDHRATTVESSEISYLPVNGKTIPDPQTSQYLGCIFGVYLLFSTQGELFILDMHAAHERITFARLKESYSNKKPVTQFLFAPLQVSISQQEGERIDELLIVLNEMGFEIELFSDSILLIRGIPSLLRADQTEKLLRECLSLAGIRGERAAASLMIDQILLRISCHASIRRGDDINPAEAWALIHDLQEVERGNFCPHGRPVLSSFSRYECDKLFHRV
jgi:DNA mismatch repair protein MutL